MKIVQIALVLLSLSGCAGLPLERSLKQPVQTEGGLVSGNGTDVLGFRGIPYAKAPIDELRWRAPQAAPAWAGVRDGSKFGPDCMRPNEYPELRGAGMSEDCLSVNVWTPAKTSAERLPVLVWIYGGGFTYGSGSHPSYDGAALARRGVVVVNFNYRMGLFGYLAHPQLTQESTHKASGNYALMDQIAALTWVQRNVAAFGGDPTRVTVAGQSAGAMSISSMMTSDLARGLFQQAILQSVGVMRPMSDLKSAEQFGMTVGPDSSALRRMSAADLVTRLAEVSPASREVTSSRGIGTIVDGHVVPRDDRAAYRDGKYLKVPMIVGTVSNEGAGIARRLALKTVPELNAYISRNFAGNEVRALKEYEANSDADVMKVLSDLVSDTQYQFGTRELLRSVTSRESSAYRYVFSQRRNGSTNDPNHGDELQYPFENLGAPHRGRLRPFDKSDERVSAAMAEAWANFVKTGNPNGSAVSQWAAYTPAFESYFEFGSRLATAPVKPSSRLDFIRDFYAKSNQ